MRAGLGFLDGVDRRRIFPLELQEPDRNPMLIEYDVIN